MNGTMTYLFYCSLLWSFIDTYFVASLALLTLTSTDDEPPIVISLGGLVSRAQLIGGWNKKKINFICNYSFFILCFIRTIVFWRHVGLVWSHFERTIATRIQSLQTLVNYSTCQRRWLVFFFFWNCL